jgi:hypothetical protein
MNTTTQHENEYLAAIAARGLTPSDFGGGFRGARFDRGFAARDEMVMTFAWAIPNQAAIDAIAALSPIVEVGAGLGYWAYLLEKAGADIVAYDIGNDTYFDTDAEPWSLVHRGTAIDAMENHGDRTLFLCWPPYDHPMAHEALDLHRGEHVAYVGEGVAARLTTHSSHSWGIVTTP